MTPASKAARSIRQVTMRTLSKNLGYSYLGFRLTPGQLKAAGRTLYDRHRPSFYPSRFFWENNAINTPTESQQ